MCAGLPRLVYQFRLRACHPQSHLCSEEQRATKCIDESEASRINLTDKEEDIVQKIKKAKTDNDLIPDTESKLADRPEARNLINIFSILNNNTIEKTLKELNGKNFSELKNKLSEALIKEIIPIGKKIKEFKASC